LNTQLAAQAFIKLHQKLTHTTCPERNVSYIPEIGQRSFRCACSAFNLTQSVGKLNQKFAVAFPLQIGHNKNAGQIIVAELLLLAKVATEMPPIVIKLKQQVEKEGTAVKFEGFVIQEHFAQQT
jgi:hypothetical protein